MKFFNRIKNAASRVSKKALVVTASILTLGALGAGYVQAEFYPERPVFDYNKGSAASNCADPNDPGYNGGRCGSLFGPVFNSFINTPSYGDERAFADASRTDQTAAGSYKNTVTDVTSGSKEVVIRTYVHNNANQNDNASGKGVAHGAKVKILLPTGTSNGLRARSYISATNAAMVEDTVDFTAPENFKLEYIPGSATLVNYGTFKNGVKLSDSIVTDGALIGSDALNGDLKGCFDYASVVEIRVKVVPETKPKVDFTKLVRKSGTTTWIEEAVTKPGDTIQFLMTTNNTGTAQIDNAVVRDVLPPHVQLVPGTVKRIDATRNSALLDGPLFDGGYNLGSYGAGSGFYTMFDAKVLGDFDACTVRVRNIAYVKTTQTPEVSDTADVTITKENCNPPAKAVTCDALTAPKLTLKKGESTIFTATGTPTNTTITGYIFKINGLTVQDSPSSTYTFMSDNAGTYTVDVTVKSPIGNVTSAACAKTVKVEEEIKPIVKCDSLTAPKLTLKIGESTVFTAKGTASNTTITGYIFKINGQVVQDSAASTYTFTQATAGTYTVDVSVKSPLGVATTPACAKTVKVEEEKTPVVKCESLTAPKLSLKNGESTTFTATGTVSNTTITGYIFKINGQVVQDSASNTYIFTQNTAGNYSVDVTVKSPAGNVTSAACAKTVHVQEEVTPIYSCDALSFSKKNLLVGENLKISVNFTATNGATFKQATFDFGDSKTYTTNASTNGVVNVDHSYDKKGNYAISAKLEFTVNGATKVVEGGKCIGQVDVTAEKCPIPGKEQYEKNDTVNCNDVKGVTTIPDTGAGSMFGLFAAVTAAGAFLHNVWVRRAMNR